MMDFSETGIVSLFSNFVLIFIGFMTAVDGVHFFKHKKRFFSFVAFGILFIVTSTTAVLTSLMATDTFSLILSGIFLLTLMIGLRFKKSISVFWIAVILLSIGFFAGFFSYLVAGETGETIAVIGIERKEENLYRVVLKYKDTKKEMTVKGEMLGFEAYQVTMKPFMHFLFGGKRFLLTSVFGEKFHEDYSRGEIQYYPVGDTFFDKRGLWKRLEKRSILFPGVRGVQRVMVSVYPSSPRIYELKITNQGLILVPEKQ